MQNHIGTNKVSKKTSDFTKFMLAVMHKKIHMKVDYHQAKLKKSKCKECFNSDEKQEYIDNNKQFIDEKNVIQVFNGSTHSTKNEVFH